MNRLTSIVYGMIGALIVLLCWNLFTPDIKPIATVNLTGIVKGYIQEVAKANLQPVKSAALVREFAVKLEDNIKLIAKKNGVIILPSEAVIAGAKDLTPILIKQLSAFAKDLTPALIKQLSAFQSDSSNYTQKSLQISENDKLKENKLKNDRLENDGLKNDNLNSEQTFIKPGNQMMQKYISTKYPQNSADIKLKRCIVR